MICSQATNLTILDFNQNESSFELSVKSKYACPNLLYSAIWHFINYYKWLFILITLSVGIIECFFGRRLLNITFFVTGFGTGSAVSSVNILFYFFLIIIDFFVL